MGEGMAVGTVVGTVAGTDVDTAVDMDVDTGDTATMDRWQNEYVTFSIIM